MQENSSQGIESGSDEKLMWEKIVQIVHYNQKGDHYGKLFQADTSVGAWFDW